MFRTVSVFRQHVTGVDPPIRHTPYSQNRASQNRPLAEQQKQKKSLGKCHFLPGKGPLEIC